MRGIRARGTFLGGILGILALALAAALPAGAARLQLAYMGNLIKGQEDYLYVWALGRQEHGRRRRQPRHDRREPGLDRYGKVIHKVSVPARRGSSHGLHRRPGFLWPAASTIAASRSSTSEPTPRAEARADDRGHAGQDR